jgi:hypothetical protein
MWLNSVSSWISVTGILTNGGKCPDTSGLLSVYLRISVRIPPERCPHHFRNTCPDKPEYAVARPFVFLKDKNAVNRTYPDKLSIPIIDTKPSYQALLSWKYRDNKYAISFQYAVYWIYQIQ